jgi:4-amino-4-deoxy-L-arabinose transferase-like glycosyltransferase
MDVLILRADHEVLAGLHEEIAISQLIEQARQVGGHETKEEAVTAALSEYIQQRKQFGIQCELTLAPVSSRKDLLYAEQQRARLSHSVGSMQAVTGGAEADRECVRWWNRGGAFRASPFSLLLFAAGVLLFAVNQREIHGTSVFYASLARGIADARDPLQPFVGEGAYLLKPPLVLWATALCIHVLGPGLAAATLASRLFGLGAVMATWWLGRHVFGRRAAWIAGVVLVTNSTFFQYATNLRMDSALTLGIVIGVLGYLRIERRSGPWLLTLGIAIGTLAKGPQGLIPLVLIPVHLLAGGRRPHLDAAFFRRLAFAALPLLAPILWWAFLFHEHGLRTFSDLAEDIFRSKTFTWGEQIAVVLDFYLLKPLERYWPWLPLFAVGIGGWLRALWRNFGASERHARTAMLLAWIALTWALAVVKPVPELRYVFPSLPPLALLAGWAAQRLLPARPPALVEKGLVLAGALALIANPLLPRLGLGDAAGVQAIAAVVDSSLSPDSTVVVLEEGPPCEPGGRRPQCTPRDWLHYYLGRRARVLSAGATTAADLNGQTLLLYTQNVRKERVQELGFEPTVRSRTMRLALAHQEVSRVTSAVLHSAP